jgi:hypothetical protein
MIFKPWVERIEKVGGRVLTNQRVSDILLDSTGKQKGLFAAMKSLRQTQ